MKQLLFILMLLAFAGGNLQAQDKSANQEYLEVVEQPPTIIGGLASLSKNLKYPEAALRDSVQGTVLIQALVGEKGTVDKVSVKKSNSDLLSEAALAAVKRVRFTPGKNHGKPVKTMVIIPVKFRLK